jgi:transcriptional regulator with XRE-family HTH domain
MTFGKKLYNRRKALDLTQEKLADEIGVSKALISYFESGERFPHDGFVLQKICDALHIKISHFL